MPPGVPASPSGHALNQETSVSGTSRHPMYVSCIDCSPWKISRPNTENSKGKNGFPNRRNLRMYGKLPRIAAPVSVR